MKQLKEAITMSEKEKKVLEETEERDRKSVV